MLSTSTQIPLDEPEAVLAPLRRHLVEHEAQISRDGSLTRIRLDRAEARLDAGDALLAVAIDAPDPAALAAMKRVIASHLAEFSPPGALAGLRWAGDATGPSLPPDFRILTVAGVEELTPHMRRIHLRGEDLARFDRLDALHVRLFIPPAGAAAPCWPMLGEDGLLQQPPPERRPAIRKYTIRTIDAAAGTLAIDFVLHDDAGPGSAFAARAQAGDLLGMAGPGGRGLKPAERYLFLADETGLPAVARMLANLPAEARGCAAIEVADAGEEQPLAAPAGIAVRWLHRDGGACGPARLQDALDAFAWPDGDERVYLWAAVEYATFRALRAAARERLRPGRDEHLVVSYWRAGMAEEQHAAAKKADKGG